MFIVPKKHGRHKPNEARNRLVYELYKQGLRQAEILKHEKVIELSDGYVLSRQRISKIIEREKQKTTD